MKKDKIHIPTYVFLTVGLVLIALPMYLTVLNSFKETRQITGGFFELPDPFTLENFQRLLDDGVVQYFANSLTITIASIALIILIVPMAAYALARTMPRNRVFQGIYIMLIIGIFVPFQVIMIPITSMMSDLGLSSKLGLIILYLTYAVPQSLFLYAGYVKTVIPKELDEAAAIHGSGKFNTYFKIIFPMMKPMHATVLILNALWIWNDFLLPLLLLNRDESTWTLPLFQFNYQGQYFSDFGPSFASYVVGIVSILIVYLFFQRHIIDGMANGSVK